MDRALNVKSVKELKTKVLSSNLITDFLTVVRALNNFFQINERTNELNHFLLNKLSWNILIPSVLEISHMIS